MTNYRRGAAFERQIAEDLASDGYWTCRAAGSHGLADVVGIKPMEVLLVQAKLGRMPHDEWNALFALASRVGAVALVADKPRPGVIRYRRITGRHAERSRDWPSLPWGADGEVAR